jgi:hypothetical protein
LAQIYLLPKVTNYNKDKGRELYREAINSFPNQADYTTLNSKLTLILYWASSESGFGDSQEAATLLASAEHLVDECRLPDVAKNPLRRLVEDARTQLRQSSGANLNDTSKWLGTWEVSAADHAKGELSFLTVPGAAYTSFSKTLLVDSVLVARQTGTVLVVSAGAIRLEWNAAYAFAPTGTYPTAGYSTVELQRDGPFRGRDYQAGALMREWTARRTADASGKPLRAGP